MKLLHAADLHLDSPFSTSTVEEAQERRRELLRCAERIFALAATERCDLILLSGDVFDVPCPSPEAREHMSRLLKEAPCPVVIAPGNHDPYAEGSFYKTASLPDSVYVFTSRELQCFELPELRARVFGYAFTSAAMTENPLENAPAPQEDGWIALLCAHGELDLPTSRYAPLRSASIRALGIDYAALGHIHNPPPLPEDGVAQYSGFPQGRSFDEQGDGTLLLVTVEAGQPPVIDRRSLSESRYLSKTLEIPDTVEEDVDLLIFLKHSLATMIGDRPKQTHLRVSLTGMSDSPLLSDLSRLTQQLKGELASLELRDMTLPRADGRALETDITLRGAFYRALRPSLNSDDPKIRERALTALRMGLSAMEDRPIPERRTGR